MKTLKARRIAMLQFKWRVAGVCNCYRINEDHQRERVCWVDCIIIMTMITTLLVWDDLPVLGYDWSQQFSLSSMQGVALKACVANAKYGTKLTKLCCLQSNLQIKSSLFLLLKICVIDLYSLLLPPGVMMVKLSESDFSTFCYSVRDTHHTQCLYSQTPDTIIFYNAGTVFNNPQHRLIGHTCFTWIAVTTFSQWTRWWSEEKWWWENTMSREKKETIKIHHQ